MLDGTAGTSLLAVDDLAVGFNTDSGPVTVVEGVSFAVEAGQTVGLVGESGCGKSVTAMAVMRLLATPPARIERGRVLLQGKDLLALSERAMQAVRGDRIGMVFQEPMTSLNPTYTVGAQLVEAIRLHRSIARTAARAEAAALLDRVGIGAAERRLRQYPHELSGGLRQRVMIAMAIACHPQLLIADEPTTALDVTIQAQIMDLLDTLRRERAMGLLLITHDLGVVANYCDTVLVMYAGRIVERAGAADLFARPRHPYTRGLLDSIPRLGVRRAVLPSIPGMVPSPGRRGTGCPFADRCSRAIEPCRVAMPALAPDDDPHRVACWNPAG
ncbi:MAG: ABC transporter ATP-binding protein [Alphaproteobacteria bacterium]